ncbi:hypothetical protein D3C84_1173610 [compost metagenome]
MVPRRSSASFGLCVRTFMPGSTGVVQEAGKPRRPSISTVHRRHEPNGSRLSLAHSLGTEIPASWAARISEVPAGTVMEVPSISTVTGAPLRAGVP